MGHGALGDYFASIAPKTWTYTIQSNQRGLDGQTGGLTSQNAAPARASHPSSRYPNWWTDNPDPRYAEGWHQGVKTVNVHREKFLRDFAARMDRCQTNPP